MTAVPLACARALPTSACPPVQVTLASWRQWAARVPSHLVPAMAFTSSSEGLSSGDRFKLRALAGQQHQSVRWSHTQWRQEEAADWQAALGVAAAPAVAVLRGGPPSAPLAAVRVLSEEGGGLARVGSWMRAHGLAWPLLPALRSDTAAALGCPMGGALLSGGGLPPLQPPPPPSGLSDLCILLLAREAHTLSSAKLATQQLSSLALSSVAAADAARSAGAGACDAQADSELSALARLGGELAAGRVRLVWMDAAWQPEVCSWHLRNASSQQQRSQEHAVCGHGGRLGSLLLGWQHAWRAAAGWLAGCQLTWQVLSTRGAGAAALLAFRPFGQGSLWQGHAYWHALHPDAEHLATGELGGEEAEALAAWVMVQLEEARAAPTK